MKVLILEDDELIADLLETVVSGLYAGADIHMTSSLTEARSAWQNHPADLVLTDWNLPDGSGLSLVRDIRKNDNAVPVVVISGRSDRGSILAAANLGINGYIGKPFSVELVRDRLLKLVDPASMAESEGYGLSDRLHHASEAGVQLPGAVDAGAVLDLLRRQDEITPGQLAERWKLETALSAKLLEVANRSSLRRSGNPIQGVKDAITAIGVPMALNQALALSMDTAGQLPDPRLKDKARYYQEQAEIVALQAQRLAALMGERGERHYTAGLMSRIGELVVLRVAQQYLDAGGSLAEEQIDQALADWAQQLGNSVKIQWRLSLEIRELIGAIYLLQRGTVSRDRLIMRAAAFIASGDEQSDECRRLMRQLGIKEQDDEAGHDQQ